MKCLFTVLLSLTLLTAVASADIPYLDKELFEELVEDGYFPNEQGIVYDENVVEEPKYDEDYEVQPPSVDEEIDYGQIASDVTNGDCDFKKNPHSYSCTHETFLGNVFPLFKMDWWGALQGEWFTVTYVNPSSNSGKEFFMAKNKASPTQPMGVFNVATDTQVGSMWIEDDVMIFENWQGAQLSTESIEQLDEYTMRLIMREGRRYIHAFNCRDFNRKENHHLLCAWDVWDAKASNKKWSHRGYIGFLTWDVWSGFLNHGVRY